MNKLIWISSIFLGLAAAIPSNPVSAATCAVPNTIANGQVADASKVMGNFTAIANCAQLGVTTTGTPANGSIAIFSGAQTITRGNLSGDVTTSGNTVTSLSNTGVTAGTYSNATIVVNSKGRITAAANGSGAGGSGPVRTEVQWTVPTLSSFTWVNQGTSATASNTPFGIAIRDNTGTSGANFRLLDQSAPATTPWTLYARLTPFPGPGGANSQAALILRNSSSGNLFIVGALAYSPGSFIIQHWDSPTSFSSTIMNVSLRLSFPLWISVTNDGLNISVRLSPDGFTWDEPVYTEALGSYLGTADRIGFGIQLNNIATGMVVNSFATTAPLP